MNIEQEMREAVEKYGHFNSTHEVYGVLAEEVEEFWELVRMKSTNGEVLKRQKAFRMMEELTQIAAIAQRAISELQNNQIKWV